MSRTSLILFLNALVCGYTQAQEYKPYPIAEITEEQWLDYYEEVVENLGDTRDLHTEIDLEPFRDEANFLFFAFTVPGHPAHPAWITRKVTEYDGNIGVSQIGYFAGDEEPFAELFGEYQKLNDHLRSHFQQGREDQNRD